MNRWTTRSSPVIDTAPAPVRRELDVTDIFATTNVGGAEFTARTIATQMCPMFRTLGVAET